MKEIFTMILLVAAVGFSKAQTWQKTDAGIKTTINKSDVEIQFYTASIVRIVKSPENSSFNKKSLSVIATAKKTNLTAKEQAGVLTIKSESISVKCNLTSGTISFYNNSGTALLQEKENSTSFKPFNDAGNSTYTISQAYVLDQDEAI